MRARAKIRAEPQTNRMHRVMIVKINKSVFYSGEKKKIISSDFEQYACNAYQCQRRKNLAGSNKVKFNFAENSDQDRGKQTDRKDCNGG